MLVSSLFKWGDNLRSKDGDGNLFSDPAKKKKMGPVEFGYRGT
ncbi:hypothetical protein TIFTF001_011460 [Ficus carica]|uniref:Uncharacterized protein n=1 Tax=Ficus carica TaxID=3494 RepID=A0AA87ZYA7_FICCA|nr:hypothetical protein TIFTF001_011460 [Ficus carica]